MSRISIFLWWVTRTHNITVIHQHHSYSDNTSTSDRSIVRERNHMTVGPKKYSLLNRTRPKLSNVLKIPQNSVMCQSFITMVTDCPNLNVYKSISRVQFTVDEHKWMCIDFLLLQTGQCILVQWTKLCSFLFPQGI